MCTTETYVLPTWWASPLVNNDYSGCTDKEQAEIHEWLEKNKPGHCAEVGESYFSPFNDADLLGGEVAEFTFIQ